MIGVFTMSGLLITAFTPLGYIWYTKVSGLSIDLATLGLKPLMIMAIFPALTVLISFQRALLIRYKHTSPITFATIIEVTVIIFFLWLGVKIFDLPGIYAASIAFIAGRLLANAYLSRSYEMIYRKNYK